MSVNKKERERAVRRMKSNLEAIERLCLKLKGGVKRGLEVSPMAVPMCPPQRWLLLILASEKRGRG